MWQRFYFFQICDKYTIQRTKRERQRRRDSYGGLESVAWLQKNSVQGVTTVMYMKKMQRTAKIASVIRRTANFDLPGKK